MGPLIGERYILSDKPSAADLSKISQDSLLVSKIVSTATDSDPLAAVAETDFSGGG